MEKFVTFLKSCDCIYQKVVDNIHYEKGSKQKTAIGGIISFLGLSGILYFGVTRALVMFGF